MKNSIDTLAKIVCLICYIGITLFSANLVTHGLQTSGQYEGIFDRNTIFGFALGIQIFVSVGVYYLIDTLKKLTLLPIGVFILAVIIPVVSFEVFHALVIQTKNSQGDGLMQYQVAQLEVIDSKINSTNADITRIYETNIATLEQSWKDSSRGFDNSGIAKCGSICTSRIELWELGKRYSDLADSQNLTIDINIRELSKSYLQLSSNALAVEARQQRLAEYLESTNQSMPSNIQQNITDFNKLISEKRSLFDTEHDITQNSLALNHTMDTIQHLVNGNSARLNGRTILSFSYSILPTLLLIGFKLFIFIIEYKEREKLEDLEEKIVYNEKVIGLKKTIMEQEIFSELYQQASKGGNIFRKMFSKNQV